MRTRTAIAAAALAAAVLGGAGSAIADDGPGSYGMGHDGRGSYDSRHDGRDSCDSRYDRGGGGAYACGKVSHSPGVLSGNLVQVPVDAPINVCGNSVNVVGLLNPAFGNNCSNR
ncbi:chaplin [Streptomyces hypolithicus]